MNGHSLPLFDAEPEAGPTDAPRRHLAAARRLSKRMARLPDQSPEQLRAGRLICRHLVAMLKEMEGNQPPH